MTSTLVIYTTKYGTTETYAKQIATVLKADLKEIANVEAHDLIFYDTVIFGAPLYLGKPYHYEKVLDWNILRKLKITGNEKYTL